ncbi:MAG: hypothetical protein OEZ01_07140 [Candidatus Heimdallarchaeota archaeon]|nr:hypothetical protein [Candidatus Heimdallarchaeota archaeon]
MQQSLSYAIISVALITNLVISATLLLEIEINNREIEDEFDDMEYNYDNSEYTINGVNYTQYPSLVFHLFNITIKNSGKVKQHSIFEFDLFSSLAILCDNSTYLYDTKFPYGQSNDIIAAGNFWNYTISTDIIDPDMWNPGEFLNIYLWITTSTIDPVSGTYTFSIYNLYGWGYQEVIII